MSSPVRCKFIWVCCKIIVQSSEGAARLPALPLKGGHPPRAPEEGASWVEDHISRSVDQHGSTNIEGNSLILGPSNKPTVSLLMMHQRCFSFASECEMRPSLANAFACEIGKPVIADAQKREVLEKTQSLKNLEVKNGQSLAKNKKEDCLPRWNLLQGRNVKWHESQLLGCPKSARTLRKSSVSSKASGAGRLRGPIAVGPKFERNCLEMSWNRNENILTAPYHLRWTAPAHHLCLPLNILLRCCVSYGYDHSEAQKLQFSQILPAFDIICWMPFWQPALWIPPAFPMVYLQKLNLHWDRCCTEWDKTPWDWTTFSFVALLTFLSLDTSNPWKHTQKHNKDQQIHGCETLNTHIHGYQVPKNVPTLRPLSPFSKPFSPLPLSPHFPPLDLSEVNPCWAIEKAAKIDTNWYHTVTIFFQLRFWLVLGGLGTLATFRSTVKSTLLKSIQSYSHILDIELTNRRHQIIIDSCWPCLSPRTAFHG